MTYKCKMEAKYIFCREIDSFLVNALVLQVLLLLQIFKILPLESPLTLVQILIKSNRRGVTKPSRDDMCQSTSPMFINNYPHSLIVHDFL